MLMANPGDIDNGELLHKNAIIDGIRAACIVGSEISPERCWVALVAGYLVPVAVDGIMSQSLTILFRLLRPTRGSCAGMERDKQ